MLPFLDAADLRARLPFAAAIAALRTALNDGPDGADAIDVPARTTVPAAGGHVLIMPAVHRRLFGVKIAGVAPDNPARGLPRITGTYLLHDAATLMPVLAIDGPALTLLRTAALSALAVDVLAPAEPIRVALYGTGPQAVAHLEALRAVRDIARTSVSGRTPDSTRAFADGHDIAVAGADDLGRADVVVCCTSASTPLFDGRHLATRATVVAMGAHTPDARELDRHTLRGAQIVVEDVDTAHREAADVAEALAAGDVTGTVALQALVAGRAPVRADGRRVFRSVGMAWEDLVVAEAAHGVPG